MLHVLGDYVYTFQVNELLQAWGLQVREYWFFSWWYWKKRPNFHLVLEENLILVALKKTSKWLIEIPVLSYSTTRHVMKRREDFDVIILLVLIKNNWSISILAPTSNYSKAEQIKCKGMSYDVLSLFEQIYT